MAEPGLLMPETFKVGEKYVYDGHEAEAYGYTENVATGLTVTTPAGTFKNCVKTREYSLISPSDVSDKIWCKGVGLISDTARWRPGRVRCLAQHGHVQLRKNPPAEVCNADQAAGCKNQRIAATEIALKQVPGKANSIKIERMGKHNVYDVEIIAAKDGAERDVFVDIETGKFRARIISIIVHCYHLGFEFNT